ncbi:uncharacterized protein YBL113C-like isoform X2 [Xenia sp. Carnegie-2017]|uniref:uncharacterized protein YBL113C-like isoform X2 n=1 Tax=Xenia sp. Carnegie-2017 TaxID=2897299 RepID=UPI001F04EDBC|nr:uncharacterized protein YBL113C-like isoform X2 [Xenia sp. Carnegie-2017]
MEMYNTRAETGGTIMVRLIEISNLKVRHGFGCQLAIWVTCDGIQSSSRCLYGKGKTGIFHTETRTTFGNDLGNGTRNPFVFNFRTFQGNLGINIRAIGKNGITMNTFRLHKPTYPAPYANKKWTTETLKAAGAGQSKPEIKLKYQVFCKQHFYGPSCTVGCLPGENYVCDKSSGRKICTNGYLGPNCTCKPNSLYNCDSMGTKIFYRPYRENCDVKCRARISSSVRVKASFSQTESRVPGMALETSNAFNATTEMVKSTSVNDVELKTKMIMTSFPVTKSRVPSSLTQRPGMTTPHLTFESLKSVLTTSSSTTNPTGSLVKTSSMTSSQIKPLDISIYLTKQEEMRFESEYLSQATTSTLKSRSDETHTTMVKLQSSPASINNFSGILTTNSLHSNWRTPKMTTCTVESISDQMYTTEDKLGHFSVLSQNVNSTVVKAEAGISNTNSSVAKWKKGRNKTMHAIGDKRKQTYTKEDILEYSSGLSQITNMTVVKTGEATAYNLQKKFTKNGAFLSSYYRSMTSQSTSSSFTQTEGECCEPEIKPTTRDTTFRAGLVNERTGIITKWMVLTPLIAVVLLCIFIIVVFRKKKRRKSNQISPECNTKGQELKQTIENSKDWCQERKQPFKVEYSKQNNNRYGDDDFNKVWKNIQSQHE